MQGVECRLDSQDPAVDRQDLCGRDEGVQGGWCTARMRSHARGLYAAFAVHSFIAVLFLSRTESKKRL